MDPLSFSTNTPVEIKEEIINSDHEGIENIFHSRSVEIYLNDQRALQREDLLRGGNETDTSIIVQADPLASDFNDAVVVKDETELLLPGENETSVRIIDHEDQLASDAVEVKNECSLLQDLLQNIDVNEAPLDLKECLEISEEKLKKERWEDDEINIDDYQIDSSFDSPSRKSNHSELCLENEDPQTNSPRILRKSLRKKNPSRHVYPLRSFVEDENKESDKLNLNIWSDNSDDDPDYCPLEDAEPQAEFHEKCVKAKKKRKKRKKVNVSKKSKSGKRIWKKSACVYCNRKFTKIVRHLEKVHPNETDVKMLMNLEKNSEERKVAIKAIKCKGNSEYDEETDKRETEERLKRRKLRIERLSKCLKRNGPIKRKYKRNCCLFCKKMCTKLGTHFQLKHMAEKEVKHFTSLEKGSRERLRAVLVLINRGNFVHNRKVISEKQGSLIPYKANNSQEKYENFLPCNFCLGFFKKRFLDKHIKGCSLSKSSEIETDDVVYSNIPDLTKECSPLDIIKSLIGYEEIPIEKEKKRVTKKAACYFCCKLFAGLRRHWFTTHAIEPEVKHILSLDKGSKERFLAIQMLRRKGNFIHNKKVLSNKEGKIVTCRVPDSEEKYSNFLPCEYCFGFFPKRNLMRHVYRCEFNNTTEEGKTKDRENNSERKRMKDIISCGSSLIGCPTGTENELSSIINKNSKLMKFALKDELIVKYGALLSKEKKGPKSAIFVGYKIRQLARLLIKINILDESILSLHESLTCSNLKTLMKASHNMCTAMDRKKAASQEQSLKTAIKQCCMIVKSNSISANDHVQLKDINDFLVSMKEQWSKSFCEKKFQQSESSESKIEEIERSKERNSLALKDLHNTNDQTSEFLDDMDHLSNLCYTKKSICLFCNKPYHKLRAHFKTKHRNEPEIKRLSELKLGSKDRFLFLKELRNKGNFLHNKKVIEGKSGFVLPYRGRAVRDRYSEYLPCEYCMGFYKIKMLARHVQRCLLNPLLKQNVKGSSSAQYFGSLALYTHKRESELLKKIITYMKNDTIKSVIYEEDLIRKFGSMMADLNCNKPQVYRDTSMKMRDLATLFVDAQRKDSHIKSLRECLQPKYFDIILNVAKEIAFLKADKKGIHTYFTRIRLSIKTCCKIVRSEALAENNESKSKDIIDFLVLIAKNWVLSADDNRHIDEQENITKDPGNPRNICSKSVRKQKRKMQRWSLEEKNCLSFNFTRHIKDKILPGKTEIEDCIQRNKCLAARGWVAVKSRICKIIKNEKSKENNICTPASNITCATSLTDLPVEQDSTQSDQTKTQGREKINIFQSNVQNSVGITVLCSTLSNTPDSDQTIEIHATDKIGISTPNNHNENSTSQSNIFHQDQLSTNTSCDSEICTEKLGDIDSLPPSTRPVVLTEIQKQNLITDCDNNEDRTYIVLGSCDLAQGSPISHANLDNNNQKQSNTSLHQEDEFEALLTKKLPTQNKEQILKHNNEIISSPSSKCPKTKNTKNNNTNISKEKKRGLYREWTKEENEAIFEFFNDNIKRGKVPSKYECEDCLDENECLTHRDWVSIKSKVYNIITSNKRASNKRLSVGDPQIGSVKKAKTRCDEETTMDTISGDSKEQESGKSNHCPDIVDSREQESDKSNHCPDIVDSKEQESDKSNHCPDIVDSREQESGKSNHCPDIVDCKDSDKSYEVDKEVRVKKITKRKNSVEKHPWTFEENKTIEEFFQQHIINGTVPGKIDCENCISKNICLSSRSWVTVKSKVHNVIVSKRKSRF